MDVSTDAAMWAGIVGFLMPLVIQQINKLFPDEKPVQAVLAFLACLVAAAGTAYFAAELNVDNFITSALIVFTLAMSSYKSLYKPSGVLPSTTGGGE